METWQKIAIVVAVFGVVIGNLALLKHAAKMDFKKPEKKDENDQKSPD
ncbi:MULTISPECIES: DUF2897 family protein [Pseudoalteromonas]|jgi:hypothetical protein|uniref:DUF2897 family protein n=1 Tax=Pseudoalteromonas lipolytica TaxID=570156 RepID=A0AAD0RYR0_9GAMM|nr:MULTISPECIES: DUF2897 family protein [Pseudoalteromonas]AXV64846.1 DUF2897 family protein [Pseudoalteromonas donghaensis]MBE0351369.1 hypothetical protein [Pseudoalteromonas lipolytica LMEB 39]MCC9660877.1 DUF2897 family protein [Pseudoalteromonas sp. MB41]QLJ09354.1 DUF2897 family protein [Pseudoalteromonas sp. JSTW]QMW15557.1 DUF2897 family protein [Pseudoalteromonas sp. MT33b]|tara:strand:+ start:126 stop:269 length:144 start_codon:yes stop_codon:yes gene_type:complete